MSPMVSARRSGPNSSPHRGRSSVGLGGATGAGASVVTSPPAAARLPRRLRGSAFNKVLQSPSGRWCPSCELRGRRRRGAVPLCGHRRRSPTIGGAEVVHWIGRRRRARRRPGRCAGRQREGGDRGRSDHRDRPGGADRRLRLAVVQRHRPGPEPGRQRLVADRRAAEASCRPHPQPGRDGQGLRRPRGQHPRGRHRRPQPERAAPTPRPRPQRRRARSPRPWVGCSPCRRPTRTSRPT